MRSSPPPGFDQSVSPSAALPLQVYPIMSLR